ncbi:MAG: hypothetical protein AAFN30_16720 [Actinomycetota bacterium]
MRNLFARRFRRLGLLSDLVMVGAAGAKLVRGRGAGRDRASSVGPGELVLAAGAGFRLLRRLRRSRAARKLRRTAGAAEGAA